MLPISSYFTKSGHEHNLSVSLRAFTYCFQLYDVLATHLLAGPSPRCTPGLVMFATDAPSHRSSLSFQTPLGFCHSATPDIKTQVNSATRGWYWAECNW